MAKRPDGYFAFKLIAPSIAKHSMLLATATIMDPMGIVQGATKASPGTMATAVHGFSVADDDSHVLHGVANHLLGTVLNFNPQEVAKCKSVFEAEQLVKQKYKSWLADAYDWFVFPGYLQGATIAKKSPAAQKVVSKKVPGARKPPKSQSKQ
jgi:hypothetical protein